MTLKIEMKNIAQFLFRRKLIIFMSTLVCTIAVIGYNSFSNSKVEEKQQVETKLNNDLYSSEFALVLENTQGNAIMSINLVKSILTDDSNYTALKQNNVDIERKDMSNLVTLFTRSSVGEVIFFRINHKDKEVVEKVTDFYYDTIVNKKISYFENKTVYSVFSQTKPSTKIPEYTDFYTSTNQKLIKNSEKTAENTVAGKANKKSISPLIGAILGLATGVLLSVIVDIKNKKIYSISYIQSTVLEGTTIIDNSYEKNESLPRKINVLTAMEKVDSVLFLYQNETKAITKLLNEIGYSEFKTYAGIELDTKIIKDVELVFILVQKGHTDIDWLQSKTSILENSSMKVTVFFFD